MRIIEPPVIKLLELLCFYRESSADAIVGDKPSNLFIKLQDKLEEKSILSERGSQSCETTSSIVPDERQVALARESASQAQTLEELRNIMESFTGCNLKATAKNLVFAEGTLGAPLMLIGEAPGKEEDLAGKPFVGRSGQLLNLILGAIGLQREQTYISNIIPWRPPGNRPPTPIEVEICLPFIQRQIELIKPKALVALGGPAAKALLNQTEGILRLRGAWKIHVTKSGLEIPTMPTLHPAYLLRNPAHKKMAWKDFLEIKTLLEKNTD